MRVTLLTTSLLFEFSSAIFWFPQWNKTPDSLLEKQMGALFREAAKGKPLRSPINLNQPGPFDDIEDKTQDIADDISEAEEKVPEVTPAPEVVPEQKED